MTDPRIALLAAALHPYEMPDPWTDNLRTIVMAGTAEEIAAAILAALPSGWCGHGGAYVADYARLRAIEEVDTRTRDWIEQNLAVWSDDEDTNSISMAVCDLLRKVRNVMDTGHPLRAALEAT